jgi:hypothetical protein
MTALTMLKNGILIASYDLFDIPFVPHPTARRIFWDKGRHQTLSGIYWTKMKMAYSLRSVL